MAKVLLVCHDIVGEFMAGPAIRYWEMAEALAVNHEVTLLIPNKTEKEAKTFTLKSVRAHSLHAEAARHDIVISQSLRLRTVLRMNRSGTRFIADMYDPVPLECLEIFKSDPLFYRRMANVRHVNNINLALKLANGYICANRAQLHLWTGALMSLKRLTPERYDISSTLQQYLGLVPFGLPAAPPQRTGKSLRDHYGFAQSDPILLWGGGIWNWLDPLTLIQGVAIAAKKHPRIRLVFMGVKHPNPAIPAMAMVSRAFDLAKELDLLDRNVFFNFGWIPYQDRTNFLLDANIGVSTHAHHLETYYSFRTRILDYLWAEIPIITTIGDSFAELIEKEKLGIVVSYYDPQAIAKTIDTILDNPTLQEQFKANIARVRETFTWKEVTKPLDQMIDFLTTQPAKRFSVATRLSIVASMISGQYLRVITSRKARLLAGRLRHGMAAIRRHGDQSSTSGSTRESGTRNRVP